MAQWFWRRRYLNFVNLLLLFYNYLPLENPIALLLNKLESPSLNDVLCFVWLKLVQWFLKNDFFKFVNLFSQFRNHLPLEKSGRQRQWPRRRTMDKFWSEKLTWAFGSDELKISDLWKIRKHYYLQITAGQDLHDVLRVVVHGRTVDVKTLKITQGCSL